MTEWGLEAIRLTREDLADRAREVRRHILRMTTVAASGHPGGSLSVTDILVSLYFGGVAAVDPAAPRHPERDRVILSKGHAAPALYAVLAERGFFPVSDLEGLRAIGSHLQGHPDMKSTPGVEATTGSLGQGLSFAVGAALAGRLDRARWRVYAVLGDGEVQEGQIWEAAMAAAHYGLDNLTAVLDHNGLQIDGQVSEVMSIAPLPDKWRAFGWQVVETDGHDFDALLGALEQAQVVRGRPTMIIARTIKGKGVSFMENRAEWHGKAPSADQLAEALREFGDAEPLATIAGGGPEKGGQR